MHPRVFTSRVVVLVQGTWLMDVCMSSITMLAASCLIRDARVTGGQAQQCSNMTYLQVGGRHGVTCAVWVCECIEEGVERGLHQLNKGLLQMDNKQTMYSIGGC